jgi:hypothetical protein
MDICSGGKDAKDAQVEVKMFRTTPVTGNQQQKFPL